MGILKGSVYDGGLQRQQQTGDTLATQEVLPATLSGTALTITGSQLGSGLILRNASGAGTDTIDSAANIIAALSSGLGATGVQHGTSWRCTWIETTANAITVQATANTGVTVTRGTVNASSAKVFLVTVVNGTPASTVQATTVNGSAVISGLTGAQIAALSIGMIITNSVAGLQGQTIVSMNVNAGTVTLSGNANADNTTAVAVTFSPVVTVTGLLQGLI